MALNFTFGGTVYDEDEIKTDCSYQLFYYRQNIISPTHTAENGKYNINAGESSHLGLDGELKNGDVILLKFYTDTQFALYRFIYGGEDYNFQDIKLLSSQPPTTTLYVNNNTIGSTVVATNSNSDEYQHIFSGATMYHKASWYGFDIFDIGVVDESYEFDGLGYANSSSYVFDNFGYFTINVKVTNKNGQVAIDTKEIKITRNAPQVGLSNLPLKPYKNEDTTINVDIADTNGAVVDIAYLIDGGATETLTHSFDTIATHIFEVGVIWDDGFEEHFLNEVLLIEMTNIPPTVILSNTNTENEYLFSLDAADEDGEIVSAKYEIYYTLPFGNEVVKVYEDTQNDTSDKDMTFLQNGNYKIKAYVYDDLGAVGIDELDISINMEDLTTALSINDDGGFKIVDNIITYYDIDGVATASYKMYDYENNPTDTYIMNKILDIYNGESDSVLDKRGGSKIASNQQIYYDIDGVESCRYNLFDSESGATMSEIFEKRIVA